MTRHSVSVSLLGALTALTLYRGLTLYYAGPPLDVEEAYYFAWSRHLDVGYYSKPPMIAWLIRFATALCGDSEFCLRLPALLLYPAAVWFVFLTARRLFDKRIGVIAAISFATLPMVTASSWLITTDVPLIFFWSAGLYFFVRALAENRWSDWLAMGAATGLGLMSKFTMALFGVGVLACLVVDGSARAHLGNPRSYAALFIAVLILLPNIVWNAAHDFPTVRHTAELAQLNRDLVHPLHLLGFIAGQFAVFGPVLLALWAVLSAGVREGFTDARQRVLVFFAAPLLLLMTVLSLLSRAHLNWAAPAYVAAAISVAALALPRRPRWLAAAVAVNLIAAPLIYHHRELLIAAGADDSARTDAFYRSRGWQELALAVGTYIQAWPSARLLADDRYTLAELVYYLKPRRDDAIWNPSGAITDQFRMSADIAARPHGEFVFVARDAKLEDIAPCFAHARALGEIRIVVYPDLVRRYRLYYVADFRGYRR
ncbi:MAG: ArnT family glycosyltransferase [Sulfurifustis sp.]